MSLQIIRNNPKSKREVKGGQFLQIAELFAKTIQGEGIHSGKPAIFLRLQHCTLDCVWCDSKSVWRYGNPYTYNEVLDLLEVYNVIDDLKNGHHLVLTGGSPLLQQRRLIEFLCLFIDKYKFKPYIEIENESKLLPKDELIDLVDCWNNSPKLSNNGQKREIRYNPKAIKKVAECKNSWFKFVYQNEDDWKEIENDFLKTGLINRNQIILMPCGASQNELIKTREKTIKKAIKENVLYSDRLHIVAWNKKTGV